MTGSKSSRPPLSLAQGLLAQRGQGHLEMPLHRPDADDADPEIEEPSCRGCHGVEIWGIQPEVIHHSGRVAFTEADRTLEEDEHLRMFIFNWLRVL